MENRCFKVSELTDIIREILETGFPDIRVEGEISNFRPSSTGHCYFSLKDRDAVLSAVLFRGNALNLDFQPEDGQLVIAEGRLSVYPQRGTYQIICRTLVKAGRGELLQILEERKRKLAAEGLFDEERKKPLPLFPRKIAVVTSPTGAALRDILNVTARRNAAVDIVILPCPVQGETAAERIAAQIKRANDYHMADVIICGRGGGSLEDLLPFSEEIVVRAVAASGIPVITGIGHEIDFALADFAADYRAPTPSAAAEVVSARIEEFTGRIETLSEILTGAVRNRMEMIRLTLAPFTGEEMERNFYIKLEPFMLRLDDAKELLLNNFKNSIRERQHSLELLIQKLVQNSPLGIMERGYAFIEDRESSVPIIRAKALHEQQKIRIRFYDGQAGAVVEEIQSGEILTEEKFEDI